MDPGSPKKLRETLMAEAITYGVKLSEEAHERLSNYYALLTKWNPRLHLVAPTSPSEFATRHILESLMMLEHLPEHASVADVGSGAGLPIIPCLIVRPDISALLIESSKTKVVFLREVLGQTAISKQARVIGDRFENLEPPAVSFVSSRALERFEKMIPRLIEWAPTAGLLLFGGKGLAQEIAKSGLDCKTVPIPNSERRFLFVLSRR
jgi:16S rRNA (guanine527-N7)-methyltransferase